MKRLMYDEIVFDNPYYCQLTIKWEDKKIIIPIGKSILPRFLCYKVKEHRWIKSQINFISLFMPVDLDKGSYPKVCIK